MLSTENWHKESSQNRVIMSKYVLSGMSLEDMSTMTAELGGSAFRAKQIYKWIYTKFASSFDEMTDLPIAFREQLKEVAVITSTKIKQRQMSSDGTIKYLLEFEDGNCAETVLMRFDNRANLSACVSSQVGCPLGCKFCMTAKRGFIRNLTPQEIIDQVLCIQRDTKLKVTNIVFMGQGEPLLNFENLRKAIDIFNNDFNIGIRRMTLSTAGIIPGIEKLANEDLQITLAISLHAPNHAIREKIMPVEKKYNIDKLIQALKNYVNKVGRRVTIEYILIDGVNDTPECAKELANLIYDLKCNINFIPYNECGNSPFKKPSKEAIMKFKYIIEHSGKKATVRLERGADIDAACGQLSGKVKS